MLRRLIGVFSGGPYYARIGCSRMSLRDVLSGKTFETSARIGLDQQNRIVAVGDMPASVAQVIAPFDHPRVVMANFVVASKLLQYGMLQLSRWRWVSPSPVLVIQPDRELDGGLSEIETRALLELGESAGARKTMVHYGSVLSDQEVIDLAGGR